MSARSFEPQDILHHLNDLRWCLIRSLAAWGAATVIGLIYARPIIRYLTRPVGEMVVLGVTEALAVQVKVGVSAGLAAAAPIAIWEVWRFVRPGLTAGERHTLLRLLPLLVIMPLIGAAVALGIVLPQVIALLQAFGAQDWQVLLSLRQYIDFALGLTWPLALAFEAPLAAYVAARLGWATSRVLRKRWRLVILLVFAAAAVLSLGPDVTLQILLVLPLLALYGLCLLAARLAEKSQCESQSIDKNNPVA